MSRGRLGELEQLILMALIRLRDNAYGVPIQEELERAKRAVSIGTVYATLDRLQEKGFVTSRLGDPTPERGGRAKRYFRLTATGATALRDSLAAQDAIRRGLPAPWAFR